MQNEKIMRCNVQNIKVLMKILKFQKVHLHPHTYTAPPLLEGILFFE
jgi:hypothetical protein